MDDLLNALMRGASLPQSAQCNRGLQEYFQRSWELSIRPSIEVDPDGGAARHTDVREYRVPLYWDQMRLVVGGVRYGNEEAFPLDPSEMAPDQFCGYYHTHPYPRGIICSYFSDLDFAAILTEEKIRILLAHSGYKLSMLVRRIHPVDFSLSKSQIISDYAEFLPRPGPSIRFPMDDIFHANKAMCRKYNLVFYDGQLRSALQMVPL